MNGSRKVAVGNKGYGPLSPVVKSSDVSGDFVSCAGVIRPGTPRYQRVRSLNAESVNCGGTSIAVVQASRFQEGAGHDCKNFRGYLRLVQSDDSGRRPRRSGDALDLSVLRRLDL